MKRENKGTSLFFDQSFFDYKKKTTFLNKNKKRRNSYYNYGPMHLILCGKSREINICCLQKLV